MDASSMHRDGSHPRPQLMRTAHVALDRIAGFAHDDHDVGRAEHWERESAPFTRSIQLPFPPESPASLIGDRAFHPVVWYRIAVTSEDLDAAGLGSGGRDRLHLHFGAVDHSADVWVDGQHVAHHVGGQTAFTADVTDALAPAVSEHWIVVRAEDDPLDAAMPRGKQDWRESPHSIWYDRTTGIWRTVWLEAVPPLHISRLGWRAEPQWAAAEVTVELNLRPRTPVVIRVELTLEGVLLGAVEALTDTQTLDVRIPIGAARNGQAAEDLLWTPENPRLIDATVTLIPQPGGDGDVVASYLGIRSVGVAHGRFLLNGRPRFLRSVLEQAFWPDTHLAAPSTQALRAEVTLIKDLGFDTARIHQKIEDPRFMYWADRLGLMLWSEIAGAYEFSADAVQRLTAEWITTVRDRISHPSIVTWVPFNESWGVQQVAIDAAQRAFTVGLTALTRALDPGRPVVSNDGWEHTDSDILTIHDYESAADVVAERYGSAASIAALLAEVGPAGRLLLASPQASLDGVPVMLTEFGGVRFAASDEPTGWGYSEATTPEGFLDQLTGLFAAVNGSPVLAGFCYTQLTDTGQERNGLCDERRSPKLPAPTIARLVRGNGA